MNSLHLAMAALRARPLQTVLCMAAAAAGVALLCFVIILSGAIADAAARNSRDIDIVVGPKGSPLQLLISTLYHADVPAGNISGGSSSILGHDTRVLRAIPLTLSDNYNGFRIVGTSPDYIDLYHAQFADGHAWTAPMQAVAGSLTGLHTGQTFTSTHGFKKDGDDHDAMPYTIVGMLKPTGTVLDRLILTDSQSLYEIHNVHHHHHAHDGTKEYEEEEEAPHSHGPDVVNYETTALLLQTRSPQANKYLALELNHITNLMAVSPAEEMSHIMRGIGMGRRTFILLGGGLTILSALMILSALSAALAARQYDIALLRVLGAPPYRMAMIQLWEGAIIGLCGGIAGIAAAHAVAWAVVSNITLLGGLIQPADMLALRPADAALAALGAGTGMLAGLLPAWQAGRADIAGILAQGRG